MPAPKKRTEYAILLPAKDGPASVIYLFPTLRQALDEFERLKQIRRQKCKLQPQWIGETIIKENTDA